MTSMSPEEVRILEALERDLVQSLERERIQGYQPYPKQSEFHRNGATHRERLLMAGNQLGKSLSAAAETAMHLTGRYPDWWRGYRATGPVRWVVSGVTAQLVRDSCQVLLCGAPAREFGTGYIPRADLIEAVTTRGVAGAFDMVRVQHHDSAGNPDGESILYFRAYEQGRERIQALTLSGIWLDEEPPLDYYTEAMTRTNVAMGPVYLTFTPLLGMSDVVRRYLSEASASRSVTTMTIHDVDHYTEEQRAAIIASYPAHERAARTMGVPMLGSGAIFPVPEEQIVIDPIPIPAHWPRIVGMDFGWDHPTAGAWLAWDRDTDTVYLTDTYRVREQPVVIHAAAIRARGPWIPVAWPHDGLQHDKGAGIELAEQYRAEGVNMLGEMATFEDVGDHTRLSRTSVEAGIADMLDRMQTGRWRVFRTCTPWLEEYRQYHRKDGKIVKEFDDTISASRYGLMMLRHAITQPLRRSKQRQPYNWKSGR